MLLLHVMMTLKKLLFVNTALLSVTDQDGNDLAVEDGHDFNATPTEVSKNDFNVTLACDDDAHKVNLCQYSSFFNQDGESLAVVDEQDFNVTPAGDDDVLKVILVQYSCFTTN